MELSGFEVLSAPAGRFSGPAEVDWTQAKRVELARPMGALLAATNALDLERPPPLDGADHWYRTELPAGVATGPGGGAERDAAQVLVFEGLATLTDVWLDGAHVLRSDNMFVPQELELSGELGSPATRRELVLCFRALAPELAKRRPRPRWRTRIVEQQQLRWLRTSLLGRTPGFCPNVPIVGPYRPIRLEVRPHLQLREARVQTSVRGERATLQVALTLELLSGASLPPHAELIVEGAAGHARCRLEGQRSGQRLELTGRAQIEQLSRWWPHSHGAQPQSSARVQWEGGVAIELGQVAFRELAVDRDADGFGFGLLINGVPLFARGACWTTDDLLTLGSSELRHTLTLAREAGMNMLRVGGTTAYESDDFYDLCDELGILLFQDFMFANMDYPADDAGFCASVEREVRALLGRIAARPCLAVLCGGSEVQQQAAMLGLSRELWSNRLFDELLPSWCAELAPSVPYLPSSPSGGDLPFQSDRGVCHYYGVGAYLRPLHDARRANVRFAAECLAFANVPCSDTIEQFMGELEAPVHHPRWKQRVPRDRGASWDFEDVRDHYLRELFAEEPRELRYVDLERYLALGHAAVGEVMQSTFAEWRRVGSSCRGALVFWLKDLWDGAGWGVIDARSRPKSAYYYLKRSLAPRTLALTDEGLNGLSLHVLNDPGERLAASLEIELFRAGETSIARAATEVDVEPHGAACVRVDALLPHFSDVSYAYRFGPPGHELTVARLVVEGSVVARAFHFPLGQRLPRELDLGLQAVAEARGALPGLLVSTRRFAQCVNLELRGFSPADDFFHLEPGGQRWIALKPLDDSRAVVRGSVGALNLHSRVQIAGGARV